MHTKRCSILTAIDDSGAVRIRRKVDMNLRRYLVLEGALVGFADGSRDVVANVIVTGVDIDAMLPDLEACRTVFANVDIDEDGAYRATHAAPLPASASPAILRMMERRSLRS